MAFARYSVAALLFIYFFAASHSSAQQCEWTVMIFMNGDNNLEPFALEDFLEMARVPSNDEVNIVVQLDRSPHYSNRYGDWTQALRFRVETHMTPTPAEAVEDIGEVNMGEGDVLVDFVNWGMQEYPARRYALVIWDHGQGWRFQRATRIEGTRAIPREQILEERNKHLMPYFASIKARTDLFDEMRQTIPINYVTNGTIRYVSSDESSADHLYNREIQDSLLHNLGQRTIDLVGFDACLMSMIETGYALRDVATVMAASEELEPGAGWNYELALSPLIADPRLTPQQFAIAIVDAYEQHYDQISSETTLSAIRLDSMDRLADEVTRLANLCTTAMPSHHPQFRAARSRCSEYAPGYGLHEIDLKRFCEQLRSESVSADIQNAANSVARSVDSAVVANYAGSDRQGTFGSSGIAIYFPSGKIHYDSDPDRLGYLESNTVYPVEFVQNHTWDNFLHEYFAWNP